MKVGPRRGKEGRREGGGSRGEEGRCCGETLRERRREGRRGAAGLGEGRSGAAELPASSLFFKLFSRLLVCYVARSRIRGRVIKKKRKEEKKKERRGTVEGEDRGIPRARKPSAPSLLDAR